MAIGTFDTKALACFYSVNQDWLTPPHIPEAILRFEKRKKFDLDPASSLGNIPAKKFFTPQDDGLKQPWGDGLIWLNPPFKEARKWLQKARRHNCWCLIPARVETKYWHDLIFQSKRCFVVFLRGRVNYIHEGKNGHPPMGSALVYYGDDCAEKAHEWSKIRPLTGKVLLCELC